MFTSSYKAAVIQMNSQQNLNQNLDQAYRLVKKAYEQGAKLAGLPENFAFLGGLKMRMAHADKIAEKVAPFLANTAKEFGIYLLGGSYPVPQSNGKVLNHSTLYGPNGVLLKKYDKIHLFDVALDNNERYRESDYVRAGKVDTAVFGDRSLGVMGLSVCYDLRFPEYYRKLVEEGAQILSVPSAFTYTTGKQHWEILLRARAIENTSYVFAPAQTGSHGTDRQTWGHAMIIDPWGKVLADAGQKPGIALAEINPDRITEIRKSIPSLEHRRIKNKA